MKKVMFLIFAVTVLAQLSVPFSMIRTREKILAEGELLRFKTRPIDPADPFQGRYVRLAIEKDYIDIPERELPDVAYGTRIYVVPETGPDGFARFVSWSIEKPESGVFLKTEYRGPRRRWNQQTKKSDYRGMQFDIPFDRYYMDETKAPEAEKAVRISTRTTNCWVNVRILNGKAAVENVYVQGQPLSDLVE